MTRYILCVVLVSVCPVAGADAYKWTDADGQVHYGDRPPADTETSEMKVGTTEKGDDRSPAEQPAQAEQQEPPVAVKAPAETENCTMLRVKLEKYKKGLIDFSYEVKNGRKVTPARVRVIKAYEGAIAEACGKENEEEETVVEETVTEEVIPDTAAE